LPTGFLSTVKEVSANSELENNRLVSIKAGNARKRVCGKADINILINSR
jgi:hypothetical protein